MAKKQDEIKAALALLTPAQRRTVGELFNEPIEDVSAKDRRSMKTYDALVTKGLAKPTKNKKGLELKAPVKKVLEQQASA